MGPLLSSTSPLPFTYTYAYFRVALQFTNYVFRVGRAQKDIILARKRGERERKTLQHSTITCLNGARRSNLLGSRMKLAFPSTLSSY